MDPKTKGVRVMSLIITNRAVRAMLFPATMAALITFWAGLALLVARFG
jgi:hypothetical protein